MAAVVTPEIQSWWLAIPVWLVAAVAAIRWWVVSRRKCESSRLPDEERTNTGTEGSTLAMLKEMGLRLDGVGGHHGIFLGGGGSENRVVGNDVRADGIGIVAVGHTKTEIAGNQVESQRAANITSND